MLAAYAAFFGAIDLDDDTILHDDVHRAELQIAKGLANLSQGFIR